MSIHTHDEQTSEDSNKKSYHRPVLLRLGDVLALTQNNPAGPGGDFGGFDADTHAS